MSQQATLPAAIDESRLRAIAHVSETAEILMTDLAMRQRSRNFSDIVRQKSTLIRNGEKIVEADANRFWQLLQMEGLGTITYGRKGKPDRFDWNYDLKTVAQIALNGKSNPAEKQALEEYYASKQQVSPETPLQKSEIVQEPKIVTKARARIAAQEAQNEAQVENQKQPKVVQADQQKVVSFQNKTESAGVRQVSIPLRSNYDLQIALPANVTKDEVGFICQILSRLGN